MTDPDLLERSTAFAKTISDELERPDQDYVEVTAFSRSIQAVRVRVTARVMIERYVRRAIEADRKVRGAFSPEPELDERSTAYAALKEELECARLIWRRHWQERDRMVHDLERELEALRKECALLRLPGQLFFTDPKPRSKP